MYGMPAPNTYGQYGFGAYGANPSAATPGMAQPAAAASTTTGDATAANAQNQWANVDPSYYQQYWSATPIDLSFHPLWALTHTFHRLLSTGRRSWTAASRHATWRMSCRYQTVTFISVP